MSVLKYVHYNCTPSKTLSIKDAKMCLKKNITDLKNIMPSSNLKSVFKFDYALQIYLSFKLIFPGGGGGLYTQSWLRKKSKSFKLEITCTENNFKKMFNCTKTNLEFFCQLVLGIVGIVNNLHFE